MEAGNQKGRKKTAVINKTFQASWEKFSMVSTVKDFWRFFASNRESQCSNKKNSVRLRAGKIINTSYRDIGVKNWKSGVQKDRNKTH
jgi:hypothetical protein